MKFSETHCVGCGKKGATELEAIDLEAQHIFYAPHDKVSRDELIRQAQRSAECYVMLKCKHCALEFANPSIAPNSQWYSLAYRLLSLYPATRWEFDHVLKHLKATDVIGEIACGSGTFLKKCREKNIHCHGVDFLGESIEQCHAQGLSASVADIAQEELPGDKKNAIAAFHILEHLDEPGQLFQSSLRWATDDAVLWIAVPSDRRPSRVLKEVDFLDQPPHHMTRWNRSALQQIGQLNGWKLEEIIYEPISSAAANWWFATRSPIYKFMARKVKSPPALVEKTLRGLLYPIAALKCRQLQHPLSGHAVLARYSRA